MKRKRYPDEKIISILTNHETFGSALDSPRRCSACREHHSSVAVDVRRYGGPAAKEDLGKQAATECRQAGSVVPLRWRRRNLNG